MINRKIKIVVALGLFSLLALPVIYVFLWPQNSDSDTAETVIITPTAASGDYEKGVNAAFDGDYETAFREFTIAAEEGLHLAQYNLGILYFTGQGVEQDFDQAFKWTKAAAEQGHINAQVNLGSLYFDGQGTRQNNVLGIDWFKSAARGGHATAAFALAKMYQEGDPMSQDLVEAHTWAAKAANNQHAEGLQLKEEIEVELSPAELSEARRIFAARQLESLPPILPNR
ncbi:MAG: hypothetical protein GKR91_03540 [Pseudomonadales bacterium]|nr:hypothetical protein [Pseudomonadales bacterium]